MLHSFTEDDDVFENRSKFYFWRRASRNTSNIHLSTLTSQNETRCVKTQRKICEIQIWNFWEFSLTCSHICTSKFRFNMRHFQTDWEIHKHGNHRINPHHQMYNNVPLSWYRKSCHFNSIILEFSVTSSITCTVLFHVFELKNFIWVDGNYEWKFIEKSSSREIVGGEMRGGLKSNVNLSSENSGRQPIKTNCSFHGWFSVLLISKRLKGKLMLPIMFSSVIFNCYHHRGNRRAVNEMRKN